MLSRLAPGGRLCINVANTDRKPYLSLVSVIDEQLRTSDQTWLHRGHIIWDRGASAGIDRLGSFRRPTNPTLRDVHEYITVWSKDQLKLEGGGKTGVTGNQFVAWTRSIWRPEDLIDELEKKIAAKLTDARKRDKHDAWIAESDRSAAWGKRPCPAESDLGDEHRIGHRSSCTVPGGAAEACDRALHPAR